MIRCAADGIVTSGGRDRDMRLQALLETAIAACPAPSRTFGAPAADLIETALKGVEA